MTTSALVGGSSIPPNSRCKSPSTCKRIVLGGPPLVFCVGGAILWVQFRGSPFRLMLQASRFFAFSRARLEPYFSFVLLFVQLYFHASPPCKCRSLLLVQGSIQGLRLFPAPVALSNFQPPQQTIRLSVTSVTIRRMVTGTVESCRKTKSTAFTPISPDFGPFVVFFFTLFIPRVYLYTINIQRKI